MVRIKYLFGSRHTKNLKNIRKQKESFPTIVKKVIDISDIILQVLDIRFIKETRNKDLEELIKKEGKKIIYVLNKADLIEDKKVDIPKDMRPFVLISIKSKFGIRELREKIKIEVKRFDLKDKKRAQIGIIGYPNAGKSSLINVLTRKGSTKTSKQAGFTKGIQKIKLAENLLLLDTPGVIQESEYSSIDKNSFAKDIKVGARTYSNVKDPEEIVTYLLKEYPKQIQKFYKIDAKDDPELLIEELGKKKNLLSKGGIVDIDRTARIILRDWQDGKIKS